MKQLDPKAVWIFFFNNLMFGIGTFVAIPIFVLISVSTLSEMEGLVTLIITGAVILLGLFAVGAWVWAKLTYHFYRYELREDGFRKEHGVIWKRYVTIPYDRIQNVDIYRGLIARILGISDVQVQTAGGITAGSYGAFSEGRVPGVDKVVAEEIRDELVARARTARTQGL